MTELFINDVRVELYEKNKIGITVFIRPILAVLEEVLLINTQGLVASWEVALPVTFFASYFMTQKVLVPKVAFPGTLIQFVGQGSMEYVTLAVEQAEVLVPVALA